MAEASGAAFRAGSVGNAVEKATGKTVVMTASGRTDAGVHALGQVVSFDLETSIPTEKSRMR